MTSKHSGSVDKRYLTSHLYETMTSKHSGSVDKNEKSDSGKPDLNQADATELERVLGISSSTALRIVDHRNHKGGFTDFSELHGTPGIGPAMLERIKQNFILLPTVNMGRMLAQIGDEVTLNFSNDPIFKVSLSLRWFLLWNFFLLVAVITGFMYLYVDLQYFTNIEGSRDCRSPSKIEFADLPPEWRLDIPESAVSEDVRVTCHVKDRNKHLLGPYDKLASEIAELRPSGFVFLQPITLTIPSRAVPLDGQHIVAMTSQDGVKWTELTHAVEADGYFNISTDHFSLFALLLCHVKVTTVVDGTKEEFVASTKDKNVGLFVPKSSFPQPIRITLHVLEVPSNKDSVLVENIIYAGDIVHFFAEDISQMNAPMQFYTPMKLTLPLPDGKNTNIVKIFKEDDNDWIDITNKTNVTQKDNHVIIDVKRHGCYIAIVQRGPCNVAAALQRIINGIRHTIANVFLLQRADDWRELFVACVSQKEYERQIEELTCQRHNI